MTMPGEDTAIYSLGKKQGANYETLTTEMATESDSSVDSDVETRRKEFLSRHESLRRASTTNNVMVSGRYRFHHDDARKSTMGPSTYDHDDEDDEEHKLRTVPSLIRDNVRLFEDPGLLDDDGRRRSEPARLFQRRDGLRNSSEPPSYALGVRPDVYQRMMDDVHAADALPGGLYFCCHGGDGAHSGASHDDYVGIGVAWTLIAIFYATALVILATVPPPEET